MMFKILLVKNISQIFTSDSQNQLNILINVQILIIYLFYYMYNL